MPARQLDQHQYRYSAEGMRRASPRSAWSSAAGFGQPVRPIAGSVIASPVLGAYDPEPDYFFHWFRDAAVVIDALRVAFLNGYADETALLRFGEFIHFSQSVWAFDGSTFLLQKRDLRAGVQPQFRLFLRPRRNSQR